MFTRTMSEKGLTVRRGWVYLPSCTCKIIIFIPTVNQSLCWRGVSFLWFDSQF